MDSGHRPKVAMLLSNPFRPDPRVLKEATSLADSGYAITIFCWDRAGEFDPRETITSGVQIVRIQNIRSEYGIGARQIMRLPWFWSALRPYLNQLKPDLVHCHDFDTLPAGLLWGRLHRKPVVYDAHEYYAELCRPRLYGRTGNILYRLIQFSEHRAARMASAVVTVDETLGAIYRQQNRTLKIIGHYPFRSFATRPARVFSKDQLNLIYVGRLSRDRGLLYYHKLLLELLARDIPARLHLAGAFTPQSELTWISDLTNDLDPQVTFHGWTKYSDLPDLLASADIGLAVLMPDPRYVAAVPVKLFEYMAAGLPVIASNFPPIAEIVVDAQCGILVDPLGDPGAVAEQLTEWWRMPKIPIELGSNGHRSVQEKYNWEQLSLQLDELYKSLIS